VAIVPDPPVLVTHFILAFLRRHRIAYATATHTSNTELPQKVTSNNDATQVGVLATAKFKVGDKHPFPQKKTTQKLGVW
jgi:hypothetical protein